MHNTERESTTENPVCTSYDDRSTVYYWSRIRIGQGFEDIETSGSSIGNWIRVSQSAEWVREGCVDFYTTETYALAAASCFSSGTQTWGYYTLKSSSLLNIYSIYLELLVDRLRVHHAYFMCWAASLHLKRRWHLSARRTTLDVRRRRSRMTTATTTKSTLKTVRVFFIPNLMP